MSDKNLFMYLDESGDHSLEKVDPEYPVFVLGGLIVDEDALHEQIEPSFRTLKNLFFGDEEIILHTADIVRNKGVFAVLKETEIRQNFFQALNQRMAQLPYLVVACAIRKDRLIEKYRDNAHNPYFYALHILVERFVMELRGQKKVGHIVAEARDTAENKRLLDEWDRISFSGTRYASSRRIAKYIRSFSIADKKENICGLQLADLIVSPIGRTIIGKKSKEDWEIIKGKFRRGRRGIEGRGLIVLPKNI